MARTDRSPEVADRDALRAEEGPLAAFFDAARAEAGTPPPAFLADLLAEATALAQAVEVATADLVRRGLPWRDLRATGTDMASMWDRTRRRR